VGFLHFHNEMLPLPCRRRLCLYPLSAFPQ
jgi:hypothetical protein